MAVVTVQAGVASHLLATDPAATAESLDHIKRAGRTVLDELSGIMTVLREPGDSSAAAPSPGLSQLEDLLATFSAAGLHITLAREGRPTRLSSSVDLVAFRVLQESLTNAHKHGSGTAQATIAYSDSWVTLSVTNPTTETAMRSNGHGVIGMKERATAVGGQLDVAASGGVFVVHATLPVTSGDE
jgi:signal transduction histidine kinase